MAMANDTQSKFRRRRNPNTFTSLWQAKKETKPEPETKDL